MERWIGWVAAVLLALGSPAPATAQAADTYYKITIKDVEARVAQALAAEGAGEKVAATVIGPHSDPVYAMDKAMTVDVKTLKFDRGSARWSANIMIRVGEDVITAMPFSGRYEQLVDIPVLQRRMMTGETIREEDLGSMELTESRVRRETVMDPGELVGKEVRRVISAGRPVRKDEVQQPEVIKKGEMIQMRYQTPAMEIRTSGEALEGGAIGQTIRIRNNDSKAAVYGIVTGPGEVSVGNAGN